MKRLIYGAYALIIWGIFEMFLINRGISISDDMQILTLTIITAGAMAGGDDIK